MNLIIALFTLLSVVSAVPKPEVVDAMRQIEATHGLHLGEIHRYHIEFEDGSSADGWELGDYRRRCSIFTIDGLLPFFGGPDSVHFDLQGCFVLSFPIVSK